MGNVQIKNVPEDVHDELRRRAGLSKMTVRDYLLELIERDQANLTTREWLDALRKDAPGINLPEGEIARLVREGRP